MPNRVVATENSKERLGACAMFQLLLDNRKTAQTGELSSAGRRTEAGYHNPSYSSGVLAASPRPSQDNSCLEGAPLAPEEQLSQREKKKWFKGSLRSKHQGMLWLSFRRLPQSRMLDIQMWAWSRGGVLRGHHLCIYGNQACLTHDYWQNLSLIEPFVNFCIQLFDIYEININSISAAAHTTLTSNTIELNQLMKEQCQLCYISIRDGTALKSAQSLLLQMYTYTEDTHIYIHEHSHISKYTHNTYRRNEHTVQHINTHTLSVLK